MYSVTSENLEFKIYLSKSREVLVSKMYLKYKSRKFSFMRNAPFHKLSKCMKYLKIADRQAHNASHRDALWACRSAIFKLSIGLSG